MSDADLCPRLADLAAKLRRAALHCAALCMTDAASPHVTVRRQCADFFQSAAGQIEQGIRHLQQAASSEAPVAQLRILAQGWQRGDGYTDYVRARVVMAGRNLEHVLAGGTTWDVVNKSFGSHLRQQPEQVLS